MRSQTRVILGVVVFIIAFAMLIGGSRRSVAVFYGKIPGEIAPYTPPAPAPALPEIPNPVSNATTETVALPMLNLPGLDLPGLDLPELDIPDLELPDELALPVATTTETETADATPAIETISTEPITPTTPVVYIADLVTHPMKIDAYKMIENTTYGGVTRTNGKLHVFYTVDAIPAADGSKKACPT